MIAVAARFLGPLLTPVLVVLALIAGGASVAAWHAVFTHPTLVKKARAEYVEIARFEALSAKLEQERSLRLKGEKAITRFNTLIVDLERKIADQTERMEQEIADYEAELRKRNRACQLNRDDIDWLRRS